MPKEKERIPFIEEYNRVMREKKLATRGCRHIKREKRLFWFLMTKYDLKNDVELAEFIGTIPSQISMIRNDKLGMSARLVLMIYDKTGMSVDDIRVLAKEDMPED